MLSLRDIFNQQHTILRLPVELTNMVYADALSLSIFFLVWFLLVFRSSSTVCWASEVLLACSIEKVLGCLNLNGGCLVWDLIMGVIC